MSNHLARGVAWRVQGATVPYQSNKYNLPMFHHRIGEKNLPGIGNAVTTKLMDQEGQALFRWRRRVRDFGYKKSRTQGKKNLYNVEWAGEMKSILCDYLSYEKLILEEEMSLIADTYGSAAVADVLRPADQQNFHNVTRDYSEHPTRPEFPGQYRHRPERDNEVSYLKPGGQQAFKLTFFPGKSQATQWSD